MIMKIICGGLRLGSARRALSPMAEQNLDFGPDEDDSMFESEAGTGPNTPTNMYVTVPPPPPPLLTL